MMTRRKKVAVADKNDFTFASLNRFIFLGKRTTFSMQYSDAGCVSNSNDIAFCSNKGVLSKFIVIRNVSVGLLACYLLCKFGNHRK